MSFLDERKALTREKRLSALSHFHGTLESLRDEAAGTEIKQRIRTFSQVHEDETIYSFRVLSKISDAAIVVNGAIGCGALGIAEDDTAKFAWYSTNLVERDTILGGDEKLREAVIRACEEKHPKAVFIIGTPVVAINNDDINSVILELEDELGIPIISIYTDGFKSKTPVSGYDIVTHSLLRYIVDREYTAEKEDFVNIISYSENVEDIASVVKIFRDLEISCQVLPQFSRISDIKRASHARASVVLNAEEGSYLAKELEEVFKVPYIVTDTPIGFRGIKNFIMRLAKTLGIEEKAYEYIEKEESEVKAHISKELLKEKTVFLDASLSKIPALADFVENIGGTVNGIGVPFVDLENRKALDRLDNLAKGTPVVVGNGQYFEKSNVLYKTNSDVYISQFIGSAFAVREGSAVVSTRKTGILGYDGIKSLTAAISRSLRLWNGLQDERQNSRYRESWRKKSGNWYVKQEVR